MVTRRTLTLTTEERAALVAHRDHDPVPQNRERCAALLQIADGRAPYAVARDGLWRPRDPDSLYAWLDRYTQGGLAGLLAYHNGGNRRGRLRSSRGGDGAGAPPDFP